MLKSKVLLLPSILVGFVALPAFAGPLHLSLVGVADSSSISVSNEPTSKVVNGTTVSNISTDGKAKWGFGGGLLADAMITPQSAFEFGALYITRQSETDTSFTVLGTPSSSNEQTRTHYVQIPVLFRVWLDHFISVGAGGYFAEGVGNVVTLDTSGNVTNSQSYTDAQLKKTDYGLIGSVALHFPLGNSMRFLVDGRYTYGLYNFDDSGTGMSQKYRDVQIIAGITFGMGGSRN